MLEEETLDTFKKVQDVNVNGVFLGSKHAIPLLKKSKGPEYASIVNLSSGAFEVEAEVISIRCN
jgi:NAD(P)-dependent dehydrogenase (short-subunit alcohol dehydrogenase family)